VRLNRKRVPTLCKIWEEICCLIGWHKYCVKHYGEKKGLIQEVFCQHSDKLIKRVHVEDSPVKITFTKNK